MARKHDIEKRWELASQAMEVLRQKGLDLTTTALAAALDIKRPTLIYYFPNRAAMVETALEDLLARQVRYVVSKMMEHDHPIDRLFAQVRAVHSYHEGREEEIIFLIQALALVGREHANDIFEIGNQAFEAHRQALVGELTRAMKDGRMHPCDPNAVVRIVRSIVDGMLVQKVMTRCDFEPIHEFLWKHILLPLKRNPESL